MRVNIYRQYTHYTTFEKKNAMTLNLSEASTLTHHSVIRGVKYAPYPDTKRMFSISSYNFLIKVMVSGCP